jgi:hypothetical protein
MSSGHWWFHSKPVYHLGEATVCTPDRSKLEMLQTAGSHCSHALACGSCDVSGRSSAPFQVTLVKLSSSKGV